MVKALKDFYKQRQGEYIKDENEENFIELINDSLLPTEKNIYKEWPIRYPFIFVIGLPRSGTTLLTQVIAHSFNVGFINNLMARFYKTPVSGIKLSKILLKSEKAISFQSNYAKTKSLSDIHEFGYFWRYWLKKEKISGITNCKDVEKKIDWNGLKLTLANMQNEFNSPMIFKNIFGSYHMEKITEVLEKVIFVYIKRDILDSAISIYNARKKYYKDLSTWWSYMPVEYDSIKDLDYVGQIAGQVFYLKRYYDYYSEKMNNVIEVDYKNLTEEPISALNKINKVLENLYGYQLSFKNTPPNKFPFKSYSNYDTEKETFKKQIEKFNELESSGK